MRGRGRSEVVLSLRRLFTQLGVFTEGERKAGGMKPRPSVGERTKLRLSVFYKDFRFLPASAPAAAQTSGRLALVRLLFIGCVVTDCPVGHLPKVPQRAREKDGRNLKLV